MIKRFIYSNLGKTWSEALQTVLGLVMMVLFFMGLATNGFRDFSRGPVTWADIFTQLFM